MSKPTARRVLVENRKARFEFEIIESFEAGIVLHGSEVKSLRGGRVHFADAFASFHGGELWLHNVHINEYPHANQFNHLPLRKRKLLMKARELVKLRSAVEEKGHTLVPLEFYTSGRHIKVKLGLARGKQLHDKRAALKERDAKREVARAIKEL